MPIKKGVKDLVREAEAEIASITVKDAIAHFNNNDHVFVDIRDIRELKRDGMVPGAFHAPRGLLEFWVDPESPYFKEIFGQDEKKFILYCASAWRSALATKALQDMGMRNVLHFSEGFNGWKKSGGPIEEKN